MGITILFRHNSELGGGANYTVDIKLKLPADFAFGGASQIPGILMKNTEEVAGDPLAGLAVKLNSESFQIQVASSEANGARNIELLKERSWFDIPIIYNNGRRAILAVAKGKSGEQAFQKAFAAWSGD